jgi:hypothetical protein
MAQVTDASVIQGGNDKAGPQQAGVALISAQQQYTFNLYVRLVLPLDGFVFWVLASQLTPAFLAKYLGDYNSSPYNASAFNGSQPVPPVLTPVQQAALQFSTNGSLHLSQEIGQDEDATNTMQTVSFTCPEEVTNFENMAPGTMFITTLDNGTQIGFGSQSNRYVLSGIWHYHGRAVYSAVQSQIVDDGRLIHPELAIVSNSLPFWLALGTPSVPVFPSFLSPLNLVPPYITAHIEPEATEALASAPLYGPTNSQSQLVKDTIRFTMYGVNNNAALDFQTAVLNTSLLGNYGIMNMPVPRDEKRPQLEFQVIAQKKTMMLEVNYYQTRARALAQQIIRHATVTFNPTPYAQPVLPS